MKETEINNLLIQGLKASEYQQKLGNKKLAIEILSLTSKYCDNLLRIYGLNGEVICRDCRTSYKQAEERDFIREFGMCLMCDQLYGEMIEEKMEQMDEMDLVN